MIGNIIVFVTFGSLIYYIQSAYKKEKYKELSQVLIVFFVVVCIALSQYLFHWIPPVDDTQTYR